MSNNSLRLLRGNILVFALVDMMGNFVRTLVFPYASLYILALGGSPSAIGLVNFIGLSTGLFILPVAGYITDRFNRVRLLAISGFLSSLFLLPIVTASRWQVVAVASFLTGTVVFQFPAYASLVADSLKSGDRGRGIGAMNMISNSLAIFAPFIAGIIIERYSANLGLRILYSCMLIVYMLGSFIQLRYLREPSPEGRDGLSFKLIFGSLRQSYLGIPALLRVLPISLKVLAVVVLLSFMVNGLSSAFWVVYATEEIGLSPSQWGMILLVEGIVRMVSFMPAGWVADRWGRSRTLVVSLLFSMIALPMFVVLKSFLVVLLVRVISAAAFGLALPASTALMADLTPRRQRGQLMAAIGQGGVMLIPAGGGVGGPSLGYLFILPVMLASLSGGYLYELNPIYPWIFASLITLVSIILAVRFIRDPGQAEE